MDSTEQINFEQLVLQILPEKIEVGNVVIDNLEAPRIASLIFIKIFQNIINCPLNYFQQSCSLPQKWIKSGTALIPISHIENLKKVVITYKKNGIEERIMLPSTIEERLYNFFYADICHNLNKYVGFDCFAFISFLSDVKYNPISPYFEFKKRQPKVGEFIVLLNDELLPDSIKHWALHLGNDVYLSKFGKSNLTDGNLVDVMNLQGMKDLYLCSKILVAIPMRNAPKWKGYLLP